VKRSLLALILALAFLSPAPAQVTGPATATTVATAPAKAPYKVPYITKTLANGLQVIVYPDSSVPLVTVEMAARNGSFTEPPELNGLSHLYEHMFFKTNKAIGLFRCDMARSHGFAEYLLSNNCGELAKLKPQIGDTSYLNDLDASGFVRNGSTQEEYVNYYYTATSKTLPLLLHGMRDAMLYPTFDEKEFKDEIQVVLGELDRQQSEPGYYLERTMMDKLFYKYPSRKNPGGTRETVATATTDKMRLIQSRYYVPNNEALIVCGDVQPDNVFKLAEQYFGDWKRGDDPFVKFPLVDHPPLPKSEAVIVNQDVDNVFLQVGWQGPSIGKDNASTYAADVFSFVTSQPGSRFQRALVDSGLATSADVFYYTQRNVGPIRITLQTTPEKAKAAIAALYNEISHFNDPDYFTDEELANAKTLVEARDLMEREKLSEYSHVLGFWWSSTGIEYYSGYYDNLRAIKRSDINKYLSTYILGKPHVGLAMMSTASQSAAKLTDADLIGK
jgi:zinc protease